MGGNSIDSRENIIVKGKYGYYSIGKKIGKGGNGAVYEALIVDGGENLPKEKGYAIKFLEISSKDEHEVKKRIQRFEREIEYVISFQDTVSGIIPVYDSAIATVDSNNELWFLMPLAEKYVIENYSVLEKVQHMHQVGDSISELHKLGYAHRDIKPKNLLIYKNRLCLSDFGLIWNIDDENGHITEVNDRLGPQNIRPPELKMIAEVDGIDYRKSDVYLFAKTIWMILRNDYNNGFPDEYSRNKSAFYMDKDDLNIETAEPLHRLLEEATKNEYWERNTVEDCIGYIELLISVIKYELPLDTLNDWKYIEQVKHDCLSIIPDEQIFRNPLSMQKILGNMVGTVGLVFCEPGKEYDSLPFKKVQHLERNIFQLVIKNPYFNGYKKTIVMELDSIILTKGNEYYIRTLKFSTDLNTMPIYGKLITALQSPEKIVRLSANYTIKMRI